MQPVLRLLRLPVWQVKEGQVPQTVTQADGRCCEVTEVGERVTSRPGPGQWVAADEGSGACRTRPLTCFLGPSVHLPTWGQMSWGPLGEAQDPPLTSLSRLTTTTPMTLCWAGPLMVAHWCLLGGGAITVLTNGWARPLTVAHWQLVAWGRGPLWCQTNDRATNGPCPAPSLHPTAQPLSGNGVGETVQSDPDDSVVLYYISSGQCLGR